MPENRANNLQQLIDPLKRACELAEAHDDFVLAAKLSDCIDWIRALRTGDNGSPD